MEQQVYAIAIKFGIKPDLDHVRYAYARYEWFKEEVDDLFKTSDEESNPFYEYIKI